MARPKKVVAEEVAVVESAVSSTPAAPKADSEEKRIARLLRELESAKAELDAYKTATRRGEYDKILLRSGGLCDVVIELDDNRSVIISTSGTRSRAAIPYHIYEQLRRNTPYFDQGYLLVDGEEHDNPNVIVDLDEWFDGLSEAEIADAVGKITSLGTLNRLYDYVEAAENPVGKHHVLRRAVAKNVSEKFGYDLVEDI